MRLLLLSAITKDHRPDTDLSSTAAAIGRALAARTPNVVRAAVETLADATRVIRAHRPDAVFNLCETIDGRSDGEPLVPRLLDRLGVAYTGSGARCLRACLQKARASAILRAAGVPVPATFDGEVPPEAYPVIVKPEREDGSVGVHAGSVAYDAEGSRRAASDLAARGQPAIVQRYVEGREISIAFLGWPAPRVLSPGEILYDEAAFAGRARILTYASKWDASSVEYAATRSVEAVLEPELFAQLAATTRLAARALAVRDYGRVDFRVEPSGRALVIDVNPNCDLSSDGGFMRAARRSGLDDETTVATILAGALARAEASGRARVVG